MEEHLEHGCVAPFLSLSENNVLPILPSQTLTNSQRGGGAKSKAHIEYCAHCSLISW